MALLVRVCSLEASVIYLVYNVSVWFTMCHFVSALSFENYYVAAGDRFGS
jgi:hypothetical protein